jgi:DNA-directed RNA polymerase subunit RPC12/RpoP
MTVGKAIEELQKRLEIKDYKDVIGDYYEVIKLSIEALSRQKPKKMIAIGKSDIDNEITYKCPTCSTQYNRFYKGKKHCMNCGQKLKWGDEE